LGGNDTYFGMAGDDLINGNGGSDLLDGGAGNDTMTGGAGNDTFVVDSTGDVVNEGNGQGTDLVQTTLASYTLGANVENLTKIGTGDFTGTGNDLANVINGGEANNILSGLGANDVLNGQGGNDVLNGGDGNDTIAGNLGTDTLNGNAGNDILGGGQGDDILGGGQGNDSLSGGQGNDILMGAMGADTLTGGAGNDFFDFNAIDHSGTTAATRDTITDFQGRGAAVGDVIDLSTIAGTFTFVGTAAFVASAVNQVRYQFEGGNTVIQIDNDGDAAAEATILVAGTGAFAASDFIL
jgi:Ca2+-binding RTX toxin-like protein